MTEKFKVPFVSRAQMLVNLALKKQRGKDVADVSNNKRHHAESILSKANLHLSQPSLCRRARISEQCKEDQTRPSFEEVQQILDDLEHTQNFNDKGTEFMDWSEKDHNGNGRSPLLCTSDTSLCEWLSANFSDTTMDDVHPLAASTPQHESSKEIFTVVTSGEMNTTFAESYQTTLAGPCSTTSLVQSSHASFFYPTSKIITTNPNVENWHASIATSTSKDININPCAESSHATFIAHKAKQYTNPMFENPHATFARPTSKDISTNFMFESFHAKFAATTSKDVNTNFIPESLHAAPATPTAKENNISPLVETSHAHFVSPTVEDVNTNSIFQRSYTTLVAPTAKDNGINSHVEPSHAHFVSTTVEHVNTSPIFERSYATLVAPTAKDNGINPQVEPSHAHFVSPAVEDVNTNPIFERSYTTLVAPTAKDNGINSHVEPSHAHFVSPTVEDVNTNPIFERSYATLVAPTAKDNNINPYDETSHAHFVSPTVKDVNTNPIFESCAVTFVTTSTKDNDIIHRDELIQKHALCTSNGHDKNVDNSNTCVMDCNTNNNSAMTETDCSRKRKRAKRGFPNVKNWHKNKNKALRMEGFAYIGTIKDVASGKNVKCAKEGRKIGLRCTSEFCKKSVVRMCSEIPEYERQKIFDNFWKDMDWGQRQTYVSSLVTRKQCERTFTKGRARRTGTFEYHLKIKDRSIKVCKNMFMNSLGLGPGSVKRWVLKGQDDNGIVKSPNYRTQHPNSIANKTMQIDTARTFLESLPKLPSHYCRQVTDKHFLETVIQSKIQLHELCDAYCDNANKPRVSKKVLMREMSLMNISLYKHRKDQCNLCVSFSYGNIDEAEYNAHIIRKDEALAEKAADKEKAAEDPSIAVFSMDLQVVLLAPRLFANASYFKTKLCNHNFTTYNMTSKEVNCYLWHECNGEVTANNFTSCIIDLLKGVGHEKNTIILYSDGCCYQNRNATLANAIVKFCMDTGKIVIQKFLEKGHTYMEVDSVHSTIENKLRNRQIMWPADYYEILSSARFVQPYQVKNLDYTFFQDFSEIKYFKSIRPGNKAGDPQVTDIRSLMYKPDCTIHFKLYLSDEWEPLPQRPQSQKIGSIKPLYTEALKIRKSKYDHLQQLKDVLPSEYHTFYDNLKYYTTN